MGSTGSGAFDRRAAITRSLLGYGVLAGVVYLVVGLALAATREGFDLSRHPLSLLSLGEGGWIQRANLIVSGAMVAAASIGFSRASSTPAVGRAGVLVLVYGACLVAAGVFPPDPMEGFPPGVAEGDGSLSGILHLVVGAVGFLCLAAAAFTIGRWHSQQGERGRALYSRVSGGLILIGFLGGAALSTRSAGILLLWVAVVVGWIWLAVTSIHLYRTAPHPDGTQRGPD